MQSCHGNHMQAQAPATPWGCLLHLSSWCSQALLSWHMCSNLTPWQNTLSQSTATTQHLTPWIVEHCAFRWVDLIDSSMYLAIHTVSLAMQKWWFNYVQMTFGVGWLQITVAKKHSQQMAGFTALKAARLPSCNLNNYVEPPLSDGVKLLHMLVTTPDRYDTCYQKQVSIACILLKWHTWPCLGVI